MGLQNEYCDRQLIAQLVKNLPAVQKTQVHFLGWEGPLEKEMATHSRIVAWRIPWTVEPDKLQSMGSQESDMTEHACTCVHTYTHIKFIKQVQTG